MLTTNLTNLKIFINDEEITFGDSCNIELNTKNKSTITLENCYLKNNNQFDLWSVEDYSRIIIKQGFNILFEGIIKLTSFNNITSSNKPKGLSLQAFDYKEWLSSHEPFSFAVINQSPQSVIERVINQFLSKYKFKIGTINLGTSEIITKYSIQDQKAFDVFDWISNYTNSKWDVKYNYSDGFYYINFFTWDNLPITNELKLTKFNTYYECDNDLIYDIEYQGARVVDYTNQIICRSNNLILSSLKIDTLSPNGEQSTFYTSNNIFNLKSIYLKKLNETEWHNQTFALNDDKDSIIAQWYYTQGDSKLVQNSKDDKLTSDYTLKIVYQAIGQGFYAATNELEAKRLAELQNVNDASYYRTKIIDKDDIVNQNDLVKYAIGQLNKYSTPYRPLIIYSKEPINNWDLNIKVPVKVVNDINDSLNTNYIITSVNISGVFYETHNNLVYKYTLTPTQNDDQAINFYDNKKTISGNPFSDVNVQIFKTINHDVKLNVDGTVVDVGTGLSSEPFDRELDFRFDVIDTDVNLIINRPTYKIELLTDNNKVVKTLTGNWDKPLEKYQLQLTITKEEL